MPSVLAMQRPFQKIAVGKILVYGTYHSLCSFAVVRTYYIMYIIMSLINLEPVSTALLFPTLEHLATSCEAMKSRLCLIKQKVSSWTSVLVLVFGFETIHA